VSRPPIADKNAIVAMRDALLAQPKGTPWVVATGTMTNVALLFATFPEVVDHIQGLSLMGGAIGEGFTDAPMSRIPGEKSRIGNVTPWAEFNIYVCLPTLSTFHTSPLARLT
jgi:uridine nucleosidase